MCKSRWLWVWVCVCVFVYQREIAQGSQAIQLHLTNAAVLPERGKYFLDRACCPHPKTAVGLGAQVCQGAAGIRTQAGLFAMRFEGRE